MVTLSVITKSPWSSLFSQVCLIVSFSCASTLLLAQSNALFGQQLKPVSTPSKPAKSSAPKVLQASGEIKDGSVSGTGNSPAPPTMLKQDSQSSIVPASAMMELPFESESKSIASPILSGMQTGEEKEENFVQAVVELPGPPRAERPTSPLIDQINQDIDDSGILKKSEVEMENAIKGEGTSFLDGLQMENFYQTAAESYRVYRSESNSISHMFANANDLGFTSIERAPYLKRSALSGINASIQSHFLNGPRTVDLPPRLHDFILGYQQRGSVGDYFSLDCAATVGIYSDFKGSAREGVRFPGHAVGMIHLSHRADLVFGIDYLDRDDYQLFPVIGISWHDLNFASLRYDLIFPRPRIDMTLNDGQRLYLAGRLGGGTWDMEYPDGSGDVMNYRDYRILMGTEKRYLDGSRHALEFGYAFDRELMMRERGAHLEFGNAFLLTLISTY